MYMIETNRLILREMTENDLDSLFKVLGDMEIMQHYSYTFNEERVRMWIHTNMERYH